MAMCSVLTNSPLSLSSPASLPLYITCHYWAFPTQPPYYAKPEKQKTSQTSSSDHRRHNTLDQNTFCDPDDVCSTYWILSHKKLWRFSIFSVQVLWQRSQCNYTAIFSAELLTFSHFDQHLYLGQLRFGDRLTITLTPTILGFSLESVVINW